MGERGRLRLPVMAPTVKVLPGLLGRWVETAVGRELVDEANATCGDCAMVTGDSRGFLPGVKCCTFVPTIPNFGVGGALRAGVRSVRERVRLGREVSPLGLIADPMEVAKRTSPEVFGKDPSAVCPHLELDTGECGVWPWRESTCATWFCKHTRGAVAKALWNRVHTLSAALERSVSLWCAVELGVSPEGLARAIALRSGGELSGLARRSDIGDGARAETLWGRWAGDLEGYFNNCAVLAEGLDAREALALGGAEVSALAVIARRALELEREVTVPSRVSLGVMQVVSLGEESVKLQGYSHFDPLEVPRVLFDRLHWFDGRELGEALRGASEEAGEEVPVGAVMMLVDFGILRVAQE